MYIIHPGKADLATAFSSFPLPLVCREPSHNSLITVRIIINVNQEEDLNVTLQLCHTENAHISDACLARLLSLEIFPLLQPAHRHIDTCMLARMYPVDPQVSESEVRQHWSSKWRGRGHPNGRQRKVPIIELVFRATGERRSGQKSQWRATLKLLQNSRFLCAPKYLLWSLVEQEALELEKRRLQFTVWAGDLQAASPTVNTNKYKQQQTHPD